MSNIETPFSLFWFKISKRIFAQIKKKIIKLDQQCEEKELVPMKHEYSARWNRYPKRISSFTKPYVPFIVSRRKRRAHQSEALTMRNFSSLPRYLMVFVRVKRNRENRSTWCSRNQQGKKRRETCEMELNNRKKFFFGWRFLAGGGKGSYTELFVCVCVSCWSKKKKEILSF